MEVVSGHIMEYTHISSRGCIRCPSVRSTFPLVGAVEGLGQFFQREL